MQGKHILFISSWYPVQKKPAHGIFNRYLAEAASLYNRVSVLHVASDESQTGLFSVHESTENNIAHVRVYYRKVKGNKITGLFLKRQRVLAAFALGYETLIRSAGKPDLIQLNVIMPLGIGALHLARKHHIPYVLNENWSGYTSEDGNYKGFLLKYFTRKVIKGAAVIMPTSRYLADAMRSHGLEGRYEIIPNVVNVNVFKPVPVADHGEVLRFIHISSLNDREKNVSGIIRAFHDALSKQPALELIIVGEGTDEPLYQAMVHNLGLSDKVKFRGRLMAQELVTQINMSDALVMFSNYETFCLVNIEAFACGKPVITSNAGAIPEYMDASRGMVVPRGDEKALAAAMLEFIAAHETYDAEQIRRFAVENFSYEQVGKKLDAVYKRVLKSS